MSRCSNVQSANSHVQCTAAPIEDTLPEGPRRISDWDGARAAPGFERETDVGRIVPTENEEFTLCTFEHLLIYLLRTHATTEQRHSCEAPRGPHVVNASLRGAKPVMKKRKRGNVINQTTKT